MSSININRAVAVPARGEVVLPRVRRAAASRVTSTQPYLVEVMNSRQKWTFRGLVLLWLGALVYFWSWWLRTEHWVSWFGMTVNSLMLFWTTFLPAWFFFFVHRAKKPNPSLAVPAARVAMIVTKAPSEPWEVVRTTLEAMLRQDFPYPYATWLADEDPARETLCWCRQHGVKVASRKGVAEYHRATWPRRTRCKEGNLAYFYDHWGYQRYDIVVQLDADHVPTPGYLKEMVRPFADPAVGYVAAPSICDKNHQESWAVRGRLFAEAPFHGVMQAGYNGGYAPSCIGSHYAVRTKALKMIGGLGPELAEDFTTTLMMTSFGWRGVFALDAEAHGDGPASFADYITQEFQWSRSLMKVLLDVNKRYWPSLTTPEKMKMGFCQAWYPLYALHMLVAYLFPLWALLTRTPWARVSLVEFFAHTIALSAISLLAVQWMKGQGWLRPKNGSVLSWETFLFQLTKWPWVLWGIIQSVAGWLMKKEFSFKVTPKGLAEAKPVPLIALAPYSIVAGASGLLAVVANDPGEARGYYYFCLLNALTYVLVPLAVVILHLRENRARLATSVVRFVGPQLGMIGLTAGIVTIAFALRGRAAVQVLVDPSRLEVITRRYSPSQPLVTYLQAFAPYLWWLTLGFLLAVSVFGPALLLRDIAAIGRKRAPGKGVPLLFARPVVTGLLLVTMIWTSARSLPLLTEAATSDGANDVPPVVLSHPAATLSEGQSALAAVPAQSPPPQQRTTAPRPVARMEPDFMLAAAQQRFFGAYDPKGLLLDPSFEAELFYPNLYPQSLAELGPRLQVMGEIGRTPVVTLEPWPLISQGFSEDELLTDLASGRYDAQLRQVADAFRRYGGQILIRFAHEMELENVYPWGRRDPQEYVAAYRYVHQLLQREAGGKLIWVWSPAGNGNALPYYPGDDVVDYVGITLLGAHQFDLWSGAIERRSFVQLMEEKYGRALSFGKPVIITELGISGPADMQTSWLREMFQKLDNYPDLHGVIYYNDFSAVNRRVPDPPDFTITDRQWHEGRREGAPVLPSGNHRER